MGIQLISDLKYQVVLLPKLDPPMTTKMKRKFKEIIKNELFDISTAITSSTLKDDYHIFTISAPPAVSPTTITQVIQITSSSRLIAHFKELDGWGSVYHDRALVKSGSRPGKDQIEEFISLSLSGV